jgi:hypothetical protein
MKKHLMKLQILMMTPNIDKNTGISTAIAVSAFADIMDTNAVDIVFLTTFKLT